MVGWVYLLVHGGRHFVGDAGRGITVPALGMMALWKFTLSADDNCSTQKEQYEDHNSLAKSGDVIIGLILNQGY